jgi:hypothetical protein
MPAPLAGGEEASKLHAIIVKCLEREPERRFQDVVELARELGPLGTDPLQAARVAKVASAARARFIAMATPSAPPLVGTPLALTTSRVELALMEGERPFAPKRRWRTWSVVAAAAVAAAVSGARQWGRPGTTTAALPAVHAAMDRPLPELPSTEPLAPVTVERAAPLAPPTVALARPPAATPPPSWKAPTRPAPALAAVTHTSAARLEPALPVSPPRDDDALPPVESATVSATHVEAASGVEQPAAAVEPAAAPSAEPPPSAPTDAPFDAWDPNTFGGRR